MYKHIFNTFSIALLLSTPFTLNAVKNKKKSPSSSAVTRVTTNNNSNANNTNDLDDLSLIFSPSPSTSTTPLATPLQSAGSSRSSSTHNTITTPALDELALLRTQRDQARTAMVYFIGKTWLLATKNSKLQKQLTAITSTEEPLDLFPKTDLLSQDEDDIEKVETASTGSSDNKDSLLTPETKQDLLNNNNNDNNNNNNNARSIPATTQPSLGAWLTSFLYAAKK
jgi:hypothetical protein